MKRIWTSIVVATCVLASSCSSIVRGVRTGSTELPPELQRVLTDYEAAWERKDAVALSELFADDGFVLASGHPPVRGRAAIAKHYEGAGGPLALHAIAWAHEVSVGYILGGYAREVGEEDLGKFTLTLRNDRGRWWIVSDMDNSNRASRQSP